MKPRIETLEDSSGKTIILKWPNDRIQNAEVDDFLGWSEDLVETDSKIVLFDLSNLSNVDSTGISMLIVMNKKLKEGGHKFALVGVNPTIMAALNVMRINQLIPVYDSIDEATKALES